MKFTESFRMEKAYFQKLKSDIDIARSYMAAGAVGQARAVLENLVDVDGAVLLLYRNLGECWADLADKIEETKKDLEALAEKTDNYHDELNQKIDDINNYIMVLIREIDREIQELDEKKQDKQSAPAHYSTLDRGYNLNTDLTEDDEDTVLYNNNYGFYIRNIRFNSSDHLRDTPDAITLKEYAIGTDALAYYLQPIKALMNNNKIKGIEILSRTSLVIVDFGYLIYEVTNTPVIYNLPAVGSNSTGADTGGIYLHTEPLRENFIDCSKFQGTQYYIFKRLSFNIIPESDCTQQTNMKTLAEDYFFQIPRFDQVNWTEHHLIPDPGPVPPIIRD